MHAFMLQWNIPIAVMLEFDGRQSVKHAVKTNCNLNRPEACCIKAPILNILYLNYGKK